MMLVPAVSVRPSLLPLLLTWWCLLQHGSSDGDDWQQSRGVGVKFAVAQSSSSPSPTADSSTSDCLCYNGGAPLRTGGLCQCTCAVGYTGATCIFKKEEVAVFYLTFAPDNETFSFSSESALATIYRGLGLSTTLNASLIVFRTRVLSSERARTDNAKVARFDVAGTVAETLLVALSSSAAWVYSAGIIAYRLVPQVAGAVDSPLTVYSLGDVKIAGVAGTTGEAVSMPVSVGLVIWLAAALVVALCVPLVDFMVLDNGQTAVREMIEDGVPPLRRLNEAGELVMQYDMDDLEGEMPSPRSPRPV